MNPTGRIALRVQRGICFVKSLHSYMRLLFAYVKRKFESMTPTLLIDLLRSIVLRVDFFIVSNQNRRKQMPARSRRAAVFKMAGGARNCTVTAFCEMLRDTREAQLSLTSSSANCVWAIVGNQFYKIAREMDGDPLFVEYGIAKLLEEQIQTNPQLVAMKPMLELCMVPILKTFPIPENLIIQRPNGVFLDLDTARTTIACTPIEQPLAWPRRNVLVAPICLGVCLGEVLATWTSDSSQVISPVLQALWTKMRFQGSISLWNHYILDRMSQFLTSVSLLGHVLQFTHNDLHNMNIMFKQSSDRHVYMSMIDFGRSRTWSNIDRFKLLTQEGYGILSCGLILDDITMNTLIESSYDYFVYRSDSPDLFKPYAVFMDLVHIGFDFWWNTDIFQPLGPNCIIQKEVIARQHLYQFSLLAAGYDEDSCASCKLYMHMPHHTDLDAYKQAYDYAVTQLTPSVLEIYKYLVLYCFYVANATVSITKQFQHGAINRFWKNASGQVETETTPRSTAYRFYMSRQNTYDLFYRAGQPVCEKLNNTFRVDAFARRFIELVNHLQALPRTGTPGGGGRKMSPKKGGYAGVGVPRVTTKEKQPKQQPTSPFEEVPLNQIVKNLKCSTEFENRINRHNLSMVSSRRSYNEILMTLNDEQDR